MEIKEYEKSHFNFVSFIVLCVSVFAEKGRFFQNGKVVDTMYVNSEEGLRVRDFPSLKSNKLCALPYRLPLKVVAAGKEESIDGIAAPWVEVLIPRYEWKTEVPEYGWVFGGYLVEKKPAFKKPETAFQLQDYLTPFWCWKENTAEYMPPWTKYENFNSDLYYDDCKSTYSQNGIF